MLTLDNFQVHSPEGLIERVVGCYHLPGGVVLGRVLPALCKGGIIVIAGDVRNIGGAELQSFKKMKILLMGMASAVCSFQTAVSKNICAIHEAKVCSSVKHVEVDAPICSKDISQNYP